VKTRSDLRLILVEGSRSLKEQKMGGGKDLVAETGVLVVPPNQHGKYL